MVIKKQMVPYKAGLMQGRWKFFNEKGKIYCAGSYINGGGHKPPQFINKSTKRWD